MKTITVRYRVSNEWHTCSETINLLGQKLQQNDPLYTAIQVARKDMRNKGIEEFLDVDSVSYE